MAGKPVRERGFECSKTPNKNYKNLDLKKKSKMQRKGEKDGGQKKREAVH